MSRVEALITPAVLRWARERSRLSLAEAAVKLKRPIEDISAWEEGSKYPSVPQARRASEVYRRPLAVFYLPEPPQDFETLRDFRRIHEGERGQFSPELSLLIRTTHFRQRWMRDFLISEGEPKLKFVGSASIQDNPTNIAKKIRDELNITTDQQKSCTTRTEARKLWLQKCEMAGIFVFRQTNIELAEARGFLVSDDFAPFIFLNSSDSKAAQIFTLAHELAHLWLNQSGVSNLEVTGRFDDEESHQIETYCNKVAAELVLENREFIKEWQNCNKERDIELIILSLSNTFKVSEEVVARRLKDLNQITDSKYSELRQVYQERWREYKKQELAKLRSSKGGPSYYTTTLSKNGYAFTQTVISGFMSGSVSGRDASSLLEVKINNIAKLGEKAGLPTSFVRMG